MKIHETSNASAKVRLKRSKSKKIHDQSESSLNQVSRPKASASHELRPRTKTAQRIKRPPFPFHGAWVPPQRIVTTTLAKVAMHVTRTPSTVCPPPPIASCNQVTPGHLTRTLPPRLYRRQLQTRESQGMYLASA